MKLEVHDAVVAANNDEEKKGFIKVTCVGLLGDEKTVLPMWIPPRFDWGWFSVPDIGEVVQIEVNVDEEKDEFFGQSSIDNLNPHYRGKRSYTTDATEENVEVREIHEDFVGDTYPKRRGFATPEGHIIYFDDTEGKKKVQITWKDGEKFQFISFEKTGALISNQSGSFIHLDAENEEVKVIDQHGNIYTSNKDGIKMMDKFSNIIEMKDGAVQIISQAGIVATGTDFTAATGTVNLVDGADDFAVRGADLIAWLAAHTHPTGMGPSGPPAIPPLPVDFLSSVCKLK